MKQRERIFILLPIDSILGLVLNLLPSLLVSGVLILTGCSDSDNYKRAARDQYFLRINNLACGIDVNKGFQTQLLLCEYMRADISRYTCAEFEYQRIFTDNNCHQLQYPILGPDPTVVLEPDNTLPTPLPEVIVPIDYSPAMSEAYIQMVLANDKPYILNEDGCTATIKRSGLRFNLCDFMDDDDDRRTGKDADEISDYIPRSNKDNDEGSNQTNSRNGSGSNQAGSTSRNQDPRSVVASGDQTQSGTGTTTTKESNGDDAAPTTADTTTNRTNDGTGTTGDNDASTGTSLKPNTASTTTDTPDDAKTPANGIPKPGAPLGSFVTPPAKRGTISNGTPGADSEKPSPTGTSGAPSINSTFSLVEIGSDTSMYYEPNLITRAPFLSINGDIPETSLLNGLTTSAPPEKIFDVSIVGQETLCEFLTAQISTPEDRKILVGVSVKPGLSENNLDLCKSLILGLREMPTFQIQFKEQIPFNNNVSAPNLIQFEKKY